MKKTLRLLLLAVLMLALCACDAQDMEQIQDQILEEMGQQIKDKVNDLVTDASEAIETIPEKAEEVYEDQTSEYTVTFVTGEGTPMEPVTVTKIIGYWVLDVPVCPNAHFLGWSPQGEIGSDSVIYKKGERIPVDQDMTLHAVWMRYEDMEAWHRGVIPEGYPAEALEGHNLRAKLRQGPFHPVASVTVRCEGCDMEPNDPFVSRDAFAVWCKEDDEIDRMHVLYIAREYGPATLALVTRFRSDNLPALNMDAVKGFDTVEQWLDDIGSGAGDASLYGQLVSHFPTTKEAVMDAAAAEEFLGDLSESMERGTELISIVRTCCYFAGSLDPQQSLGDRTVYMLKTLEPIIACAPAGSYYSQLLEVLGEGMELWEDCKEQENNYYAVLTEALNEARNGLDKNAMSYFIHGQYMTVLEDAALGRFGTYAPTAMEVIDRINREPKAGEMHYVYGMLGEQEKRFIAFYITEYLDWQFRQRTGVDLDTYVEYLRG